MTAREIIDYVSVARGIPRKLIVEGRSGGHPHHEVISARRLAAGWMRAYGFSYPKIGRALGGRHHTTIMHLLTKPLGSPWKCTTCGDNGHNRQTCERRAVG